MYKKILVPHAGTKAGNKALLHAKNLAKTHNSKITILHVVERIPTPPMITFDYERAQWRKDLEKARMELKREMYEKMQVYVDQLKEDGISCTLKVVEGYPEEEISRISNSDNFDIIVMAKRRKLPGIKAILKLGSVSRKVLERISTPILLIDGEK